MTALPRSSRTMRLVGLDADGPTDAALLVAVALGDEGACRTFVDRHSSRVFGLALSVCRDRPLAEDVAQRAFEQAWRHAGSYDPDRASARTWLLTITRRLAIDEVRRRRPVPLGPDDLDAALSPSSSDTERSGLEAVERDRVAAALAELPESQRRAVVFAALGGRSASEIADIEGIPLGTAKTRVRLGLRRLRAGLSGERNHD